jgi:hypothetical protein
MGAQIHRCNTIRKVDRACQPTPVFASSRVERAPGPRKGANGHTASCLRCFRARFFSGLNSGLGPWAARVLQRSGPNQIERAGPPVQFSNAGKLRVRRL